MIAGTSRIKLKTVAAELTARTCECCVNFKRHSEKKHCGVAHTAATSKGQTQTGRLSAGGIQLGHSLDLHRETHPELSGTIMVRIRAHPFSFGGKQCIVDHLVVLATVVYIEIQNWHIFCAALFWWLGC